MTERYLWIIASLIFVLLGSLHLFYTFFSNKFSVRDQNTEELMRKTFPVITAKTTMWKAWIGFNASHSIGGVFFGVVNWVLATAYFEILKNSVILITLTLLVSCFYLFLGYKYWFAIPRTGILISTVCFVIAVILIITK